MSDPIAQSPLRQRLPLAGGDCIALSERAFDGLISLRGDAGELNKAKLELPNTPGLVNDAGGYTALWISPDEWLLHTAPENIEQILREITQNLSGLHHQLIDLSDQFGVLEVVGPKSCDVLSKLTQTDLHERAFKPNTAKTAVLGKCSVILWKTGGSEMPVVRIILRRSFADYLWCLIADAAGEWGMQRAALLTG